MIKQRISGVKPKISRPLDFGEEGSRDTPQISSDSWVGDIPSELNESVMVRGVTVINRKCHDVVQYVLGGKSARSVSGR